MIILLYALLSLTSIGVSRSDLIETDGVVFDFKIITSANLSDDVAEEIQNSVDDKVCRQQFNGVLDASKDDELWARKVMDSWGTLPPTGHLFGRYADLGNFDECMTVTQHLQNSIDTFTPQYCFAHYPLDDTSRPSTRKRKPRLFMESREPTELVVGVCVPDTCDTATLNEIFKEMAFNRTNNTIDSDIFKDIQCSRKDERHLTGIDIFAITLYSIIGALLVLGTFYDVCTTKKDGNWYELLLAFSIKTNAKKLFNVDSRSSSKDTISCLHGIRSLSLIWVIYSHTVMMYQFFPLLNYDSMWEYASGYYAMIAISGPIAVDSFFLLSGLLVTLHVYREIDRNGPLTIGRILKMYVHRYLRLFHILAATILFCVTLYKYIGDGPYWNMVNMAVETPCRYFWWVALLHLQNYVNSSAMCLGHTWYLSADTQLYILSPLLLIPLKKWGRKFLNVVILLMCASCLYIFVSMMVHDFSMKLLEAGMTGDNDKKVLLYYGFHTRAPPYLVGIILGHALYSLRKKTLEMPKLVVLAGWLVSLAVISAIIWGPYQAQQRYAQPTRVESASFEALDKVAWAVALAWIVFACCQGYGGMIDSFLSSPLWLPLSRLSYTIYVIHLLFQVTMLGIVRTDVEFSDINAIRTFWSDFGLILSISIVMVLAFESPTIALEKHFLGNKTRPSVHATENVTRGSVETLESEISVAVKS